MTRFRAFGAAAVVLVLAVVGLLAVRDGPAALVTPGPLARPHAALECASCHEGAGAVRAVAACAGCHGPHQSVRPAHAVLARTGELDCSTCHAVHRSESGLAFEPDGDVFRYGTGFEHFVGRSAPPVARAGVGAATLFVPLVSRDACQSCHDLERPSDPAWSCFTRNAGEAEAFSLCFDEHRRPAERSAAQSAERDAVAERARGFAASAPRERLAMLASGGATIGAGALLAGLFVAFARRRASRRERTRRLPVVPGLSGSKLPSVDATRCLGCQACVDACPYDVLEMKRYVAVVSRPEQCCGAGSCLTACPNGSLSFRGGTNAEDGAPRAVEREPRRRPGIRFAGDVTGGSLIRNALAEGVSAARAVAEELGSEGREPKRSETREGTEASRVELVVVGGGPAGLAAGLEAKRLGIGVAVLEQASIAESIRRYSREKLVLDTQPSALDDLPLFIGDSTKEELLRRWLREVRARGLDVREGIRVLGIERRADDFVVRAAGPGGGVSVSCRRVVIATGRRGSPRKLDAAVPEGALGRVHYELSDARAFTGSRAVVVGLGDVAMETALALSLVPGTTVTMVHRGSGFSRGRQTNIERIGRRVAEGRIGVVFHAEVRAIGIERLIVEVPGSERALPYDALFVHIGAEAPSAVPIEP